MHIHRTLSVALVIIWSAVGVSCSYGKGPCTKPTVRKEWRAFSTTEKAEWIRAVNCLSHQPHDPALAPSVDPSISLIPSVNASGSYYDGMNRSGVHPHGPEYSDAPDFFESSFWKDSDPLSGLGGWGDPNADFGVPDGGFDEFHLSYPSSHILRRNFTLYSFAIPDPLFTDQQKEGNATISVPVIEAALETSAGDFKGFQKALEIPEGPHTAVHLMMGGDLAGLCPINAPPNCTAGPTWSPNEPLFWMHHGMIDKLWYDWQHRNPANANSFFGGSVQSLESLDAYNQYPNGAPPYLSLNTTMPADELFPELVIGDVLNTTGGVLCYVYE